MELAHPYLNKTACGAGHALMCPWVILFPETIVRLWPGVDHGLEKVRFCYTIVIWLRLGGFPYSKRRDTVKIGLRSSLLSFYIGPQRQFSSCRQVLFGSYQMAGRE